MTTTEAETGLVARAKSITEREIARYAERTPGSQAATDRTRLVMPAGVPSSFQAYDPHPIVVRHAAGAHMTDVDGNVYVDYDMGFGALFAGLLFLAYGAASHLPVQLFPGEFDTFNVLLEAPPDSSLEQTDRVAAALEQQIAPLVGSDLLDFSTTVGSSVDANYDQL